jgi:tetratricopeptide (TPR) repeat protein
MIKMAQRGSFFTWLLLFFIGTGHLNASNNATHKQRVTELLETGKAQAAIDTLTNMRLRSLEDPELYFLLGKANLGIHDYKNAEVAFKMALYFKNAYPEANFELGRVKLKTNYPNEALYFFDQTVKQRPEWDEAVRKLGESYFLVERFDPALDAFSQLIKKNPRDFIAYYFVGKIRRAQNLLDAAVWNWQECLKIVPDYLPALRMLSEVYLQSDRPDDALALFDRILKSEPDSLRKNQNVADLFANRGKLRLEHENWVGAFLDFRNVQLIFPEDPETRKIIEEIDRRTNYDSLMTRAGLALDAHQLEDAQLLFTKALVLAKNDVEEDSVTVFLDSLNSSLNERRYEVELNSLSAQAEKAFAGGDYERALTLYQKVILLNPTDQFSLAAFKESGSLKYFIQAIREWNSENWEAALKSFDHVVAYYPNFPQMKAKHQALQQIKQLENQQILLRKALETGSYPTARDLFVKIFQADPKNPKFAEVWFQIKSLGKQIRIETYLRQAIYFFIGVLILSGAFLLFLWQRQRTHPYSWKIAGLFILMIIPTLLIIGALVLSFNLQKPTEIELQVTADHASFFLEPDQNYEFSIISDSISLPQISQLRLEQIQLQSRNGAVRRDLANPLNFPADSLKEPLALQFNTGQLPLTLTNCRFFSPTKIVLRPGKHETGMTLVPHPVQKNFATWFRGEIPTSHAFQMQIPVLTRERPDSTGNQTWLQPGNYWGQSLGGKTGLAKLAALGPHFQVNFTQPGKLKFQQTPIADLSFKRFLPGDGSVRTLDGFQKAEISFFVAGAGEKKIKINQKFSVFPNRFMLQSVENQHGKITLLLTGILTNLELQAGKSGVKEIIPNYFSWYWQKSGWVIILAGILWLVNLLGCLALLVRVFQQRQNEIYSTESATPTAAEQSVDQMMENIHENWAQNLNQLILPKWQAKIGHIQARLNHENHTPGTDALVTLLQRSEQIFEERKSESDKYSSGENND